MLDDRSVSASSRAGRRACPYERSGHLRHFREDMFPPMAVGGEELILRPSNCPHHILVFGATPHSFRDLPVRLAELGTMFRYERSGVVGGLSRVRAMTLNDAHIFAAAGQVADEVAAVLDLIAQAYAVLGIDDHHLRLSLRGQRGSDRSYVDAPAAWRRSEAALRSVLTARREAWGEVADEAAFYGPKIDVQVSDAQAGRRPCRPCRWICTFRPCSTSPSPTPTASGPC